MVHREKEQPTQSPPPIEATLGSGATDELVNIIDIPTIRNLFFTTLGNHQDKERIQNASIFAEEALKGRMRNKGRVGDEEIPDVVHAYRVGIRLLRAGIINADALMLALVHDVLEDTKVTKETIAEKCGSVVANGTEALSRSVNGGKEVTDADYFKQIKQSEPSFVAMVMAVKLADRIDNLWALLRMDYTDRVKKDDPKSKTVAQAIKSNLKETELYMIRFKGVNSMLAAALDEVVHVCQLRIAQHEQKRDARLSPRDQPAA